MTNNDNNYRENKSRTNSASRLLLLLASSAAISTFAYSGTSLAAVNPINLVDSSYWYQDEDIRAILKNRLDENQVYVAPALPFESQVLVTDIVRDSVNEARIRGVALIPINFGNAHWKALAIKRTNAGTIKVIYNDSLGSSIDGRTNSALLANILQQIDPTIEIIDLQVHQQRDGSSCGAFTAENLIKIAELDVSNLTDDQLRAVLASINDAGAIRKNHFYLLYEGTDLIDVNALKPRAETTAEEFKSQNRQLIRNILNVSSLTNDRLNSLNRVNSTNSFYSGFASGDDDLNYGAWVKGFIGKETDKANIGSGSNSNTSRSKSDIYGFVIGADTKIDEDLTIGLAYSHIASNTKQKISGISTNNDKISSHILSIYGSGNIDEDISLNGNVSYGKAFIKTTHTGVARSSKQKGDLFGSNLTANYKLYQT
ncbi:MAG: autotransporter domain-containing protein, partial [Rickettsiaceae bacterium]